MKHSHEDRKQKTSNHINRIIGQMNTLKDYVLSDVGCEEISALTTSTAKSFDSLRARTLEGYILNELVDEKISKKKAIQLKKLLNLHKK